MITEDGIIRNDFTRAERFVRKFCDFMWECWTPEDIRTHWAGSYDMLASIEADYPELFEIAVREIEGYGMRPQEVHQHPSDTGIKPEENLMATNPNFLKIMVNDVEIKWPRLDQPYRFDPNKKETVACAANAQGAGFSIHWLMTKEQANTFGKQCVAHYTECQGRETLPAFTRIFGSKPDVDKDGNPTGMVLFRAKRNAMSSAGQEMKPPQVIGLDLQPLADPAIWSGSKGNIRATVFPSTDPQTQEGGISIIFDAVQVTEAVYGGANLEDDFGPAQAAEGSVAADFTPAATVAAAAASAAPAGGDLF